MKRIFIRAGLPALLLALGSPSLPGQTAPGQTAPVQRVSHAELAARQQASAAGRDLANGRKVDRKSLLRGAVTESEENPLKHRPPADSLIDRSAILASKDSWSLVPREAVLHIPSYHAHRVNGERNGKLVSWRDFQAQNRGWLHLYEVSLAQAAGEEPIPKKVIESFKKSGQIVIAVCQGGPISVKPLKLPPPPEEEGAEPRELTEEERKEEFRKEFRRKDLPEIRPGQNRAP